MESEPLAGKMETGRRIDVLEKWTRERVVSGTHEIGVRERKVKGSGHTLALGKGHGRLGEGN